MIRTLFLEMVVALFNAIVVLDSLLQVVVTANYGCHVVGTRPKVQLVEEVA